MDEQSVGSHDGRWRFLSRNLEGGQKVPHPAYITSVLPRFRDEKARLRSALCTVAVLPPSYITFTLVPPVPNTCPRPLHIPHRVPPTAKPPMSRCFVFRAPPSLDASDSDGRARGRVGREYARARLGQQTPHGPLWGARVDVEGPTMEAVASGCATWGVWGRRRVEEAVYKSMGEVLLGGLLLRGSGFGR